MTRQRKFIRHGKCYADALTAGLCLVFWSLKGYGASSGCGMSTCQIYLRRCKSSRHNPNINCHSVSRVCIVYTGHIFFGGDQCHLSEAGLRALAEVLLPTLEASLHPDDVFHTTFAICLCAVRRNLSPT